MPRNNIVIAAALTLLCWTSGAAAEPTTVTGREAGVMNANAFSAFLGAFMPGAYPAGIRNEWDSYVTSVKSTRGSATTRGSSIQGKGFEQNYAYVGPTKTKETSVRWNWKTREGTMRVRNKQVLDDFRPDKLVTRGIATARIKGGKHTVSWVYRSRDGKEITGEAVSYRQYTANSAALGAALPRVATRPHLGHKIVRWFDPQLQDAMTTSFHGLNVATVRALSKTASFGLSRLRTRTVKQSQPTLPRANRPPTKLTRGTEYRLHEGGATHTISRQAYKQLRGYGKRVGR